MGKIINANCKEYLQQLQDNSVDLIFTDPPYALGSEVIIREDGKPDYSKAVDFMDKWEQPDGAFWEEWFKQAFRVLKYGGRVLMFSMDRQSWFNAYYAQLGGFQKQQSLYWYFISNFPKSANLAMMIDKNFDMFIEGKETKNSRSGVIGDDANFNHSKIIRENNPQSDLAKKYSGYKYSVAPLKQTVEEIMVFQKPYKTGSCLHDVLAYENGDKECLCAALDINGNRVPFESDADKKETTDKNQHQDFGTKPMTNNICYGDFSMVEQKNYMSDGRFPAQTFIDSETAKILNKQSGISKGSDVPRNRTHTSPLFGMPNDTTPEYSDTGGCSRILHKCDYDEIDFDLYVYCPKVGDYERNAGCDSLPEKELITHNPVNPDNSGNNHNTTGQKPAIATNNHPTVKPISLLIKILSLFKTPNPQLVIDTFAGSGSIGIACEKLEIDYILVEQEKEYCDISGLRIKYWAEKIKNNTWDIKPRKAEIQIENQLELFE